MPKTGGKNVEVKKQGLVCSMCGKSVKGFGLPVARRYICHGCKQIKREKIKQHRRARTLARLAKVGEATCQENH